MTITTTTRRREPNQTRRTLLQAAFEEIHRKGFQGANLRSILYSSGLTKGALYHHFANKNTLGYIVVEEIISLRIKTMWMDPLTKQKDPISALQSTLSEASRMDQEQILLGCPLNNLAQEMSLVDEGFRLRLNRVFESWRESVADALRRGQKKGSVRSDVNAPATAIFIISALEGCMGMAKNAQNTKLFDICSLEIHNYLEGLREQ